jgi:predicted nuclease of predicted toxin-antitoxin system
VSSAEAAALLLDEMFPPQLADLLIARGIDCLAIAGGDSFRGADDMTVLELAVEQGRVLMTKNAADFEKIRRQRIAESRPNPALIYVSDARFPRDRRGVGRVADAVQHALAERLIDLHGGVLWLEPFNSSAPP